MRRRAVLTRLPAAEDQTSALLAVSGQSERATLAAPGPKQVGRAVTSAVERAIAPLYRHT